MKTFQLWLCSLVAIACVALVGSVGRRDYRGMPYYPGPPSGAANLVYATPNGSAGVAALRALVAGDIPSLAASYCALTGCTWAANVVFGAGASATNTVAIQWSPNVADGASSVAYDINNGTTLTTGLVYRVRNNGTVRLSISGGGATTVNGTLQVNSTLSTAASALIVSGGTTFSALGTPGNGSLIYCSDCTIAATCAGSGTGAFAKRLNGVWVCN